MYVEILKVYVPVTSGEELLYAQWLQKWIVDLLNVESKNRFNCNDDRQALTGIVYKLTTCLAFGLIEVNGVWNVTITGISAIDDSYKTIIIKYLTLFFMEKKKKKNVVIEFEIKSRQRW